MYGMNVSDGLFWYVVPDKKLLN